MKPVIAALILLLLTAAPAPALMLEVPFDRIVTGADAVVRGEVAERNSFWTPDGHTILTEVTVRVDATWKGSPRPGDSVRILVEGGEVGAIGIRSEHQPVFRDGERVVVFLMPPTDGIRRVLHLEQGKFTVVLDQVVNFKGERTALSALRTETLQLLPVDPD